MAKKVAESTSNDIRKIRPASSPEATEQQMIALAINQAQKQLAEGNAPTQIVVHYLKLGTKREQLELEKLKRENALLETKEKVYASAEEMKEIAKDAIKAFKGYSGQVDDEDEEDEEY